MQLINKYFPDLSALQIEQLTALGPLYNLWNQRINVISRKDIDQLYLHHILHSLAISKIIKFNPESRIIDAGTGGGFPGLPLAIMFPETDFILVDSIKKKIGVVNAIIKETGLRNCITMNLRLEDVSDKCDFVVCRAVTEIPKLCKLVAKNIIPGGKNQLKNGLLALKGGDLSEELHSVKDYRIYNLEDHFAEPFFQTKKLVYLPR